MVEETHLPVRAFKSAWFAKAAKKSRIGDDELCDTIKQVMQGKADDLGGGVYKKRLNGNMHRSIVLARGGRYWAYEYLFAKKDRDNIEDAELAAFRTLAKGYAALAEKQIKQMLQDNLLMEICHDNKTKI